MRDIELKLSREEVKLLIAYLDDGSRHDDLHRQLLEDLIESISK